MDREAYVTSAFDGYARTSNDAPGAELKYWASDIKPAYDPEKAKSLLKAARPEGMNIELVTAPVVPGMVEVATLWTAQAAAAGVKAKVKQLAPSTYYTPTVNPGYLTDQRSFAMTYWQAQPSLSAFYLLSVNRDAAFNDTGWGRGRSRAGQADLRRHGRDG